MLNVGLKQAPGTICWELLWKSSLMSKLDIRDLNVSNSTHPSLNIEAATLSKPTDIAASQSETSEQVPVRQQNIFVSGGSQKLPFGFVRSSESPKETISLPTSLSIEWWWSRMESLLGVQSLLLRWPFHACIELQSAADLPHVRLVVVTVQGKLLCFLCKLKISSNIATDREISGRG